MMAESRIDVTSAGRDNLSSVLSVVFSGIEEATWYAETRRHGLVLFHDDPGSSCPDAIPAPMAIRRKEALDLMTRWLQHAEYDEAPGGGHARGWRLYNEAMGLVGDMKNSFIAVEPAWIAP